MAKMLELLVRVPSGSEADVLRGRILELGEIVDVAEAALAAVSEEGRPSVLGERDAEPY